MLISLPVVKKPMETLLSLLRPGGILLVQKAFRRSRVIQDFHKRVSKKFSEVIEAPALALLLKSSPRGD